MVVRIGYANIGRPQLTTTHSVTVPSYSGAEEVILKSPVPGNNHLTVHILPHITICTPNMPSFWQELSYSFVLMPRHARPLYPHPCPAAATLSLDVLVLCATRILRCCPLCVPGHLYTPHPTRHQSLATSCWLPHCFDYWKPEGSSRLMTTNFTY